MKDVLTQGYVDGWMDRRKIRQKWRVNIVPWSTLCRKTVTLTANTEWLKLEVSSLALNPSETFLLIETTFWEQLKLWRDAGRIFTTPLPVETITCPFRGKKEANISDESWCRTSTLYNAGNSRLRAVFGKNLLSSTQGEFYWLVVYIIRLGSKLSKENSAWILLLRNIHWNSTLSGQQSCIFFSRSLLRFSNRRSAIMINFLWILFFLP
jgi:hypothetical protein